MTALVVLVVLVVLASCVRAGGTPSGAATSLPTPVSRAGALTLTVWDQEISDSRNAEIAQLDREFAKKYPNVRINRVSRSFANLTGSLVRASSRTRPPDVVELGGGYADLGAAARAGVLRPLDGYADTFRWARRYPRVLLDLNRFSPGRSAFGAGHLYGLPQTGELVGIYYNAQKLAALGLPLPRTWAEFEQSLARIRAAGQLPVQFGNVEGYPATQLFGMIQDQTLGARAARDVVFGRAHASFASAGTTAAARTLTDWARDGYLRGDANRVGYRDAWQQFAAGRGVYLVGGSGLLADLQRAMGTALGFMPPPPAGRGRAPVSTGGYGMTWSVTARSRHADVAAAYLDFITSGHAADVMTQAGTLPAMPPSRARVPAHTAQSDVVRAWTRVAGGRRSAGLVPFLDYCTPTFRDTAGTRLRALLDGRVSPQAVVAALERDYASFQASR